VKDLSIIIVNYNVKDQIRESMRSIVKNTSGIDYEVVVIDNSSTEQGIEQIVSEFPQIKFIQNPENAGFAKANNKAALVATGRNLLFLNPDTLLFNNALRALTTFIDSRDDAGIVGPKLYKNMKKEYHPLYVNFTTPFKLFTWHLPLHRATSRIYYSYFYNWKITRSVDWVCGAALLIKRSLWVELQGFDQKFFMYCEDQDLCLRAKERGYKVFFYPQAQIVHLGGFSANQTSERSCQHYWESKLYFLRKYFSAGEIKWFMCWFSSLIKVKLILGLNPSYNKKVLEVLKEH
jgi:GT2 family glycosyltransferase